jgi:thymidylate synthase
MWNAWLGIILSNIIRNIVPMYGELVNTNVQSIPGGNLMMKGNIPVLHVEGEGLAEAWERSLVAVSNEGCDVKTEYDKPEDPPSKDCSMTIVVQDPLAEPMIHKDLPGGILDLQEYVMEVLDGIKDHLIRDPNDPDDTRWEYTYHQRLFEYTLPDSTEIYNQIENLASKLAKVPYTRRANVRFRSNDAYKAAFMNMFALVRLQERIAERVSELSGHTINLGRYVHQADSYHIYGSYFEEFEKRFMGAIKNRSFEERTFRYEHVKDMMEQAIPGILDKAANMGSKRNS